MKHSNEVEFRNEDDKHNHYTYNNYIKFIDDAWDVEEKYESIIHNLENLSFIKLSLGHYADAYILEIKKRLPQLSDRLDDEIKDKKFHKAKVDTLKRLKHKAEKLVNEKAIEIRAIDEEIKSNDSQETKHLTNIKHPEYNPNYFNYDGFGLFKYLVENYVFTGKKHGESTRLNYIWHYFHNELYDDLSYIKFKFLTKSEYQKFIKESYDFEINNTDKKPSYENKHLKILNEHFNNFKSTYHKIR